MTRSVEATGYSLRVRCAIFLQFKDGMIVGDRDGSDLLEWLTVMGVPADATILAGADGHRTGESHSS